MKGFSPRNGESVLKKVVSYHRIGDFWFQSPQWGKCSKAERNTVQNEDGSKFQSPQWGKCSKAKNCIDYALKKRGFSPRNGESVLKEMVLVVQDVKVLGFSPRNGESVLKNNLFIIKGFVSSVSVPAMGKVF